MYIISPFLTWLNPLSNLCHQSFDLCHEPCRSRVVYIKFFYEKGQYMSIRVLTNEKTLIIAAYQLALEKVFAHKTDGGA